MVKRSPEKSEICGCFHCCEAFTVDAIKEWVDDDSTGLCPYRGIDSVIGSASGFPAGEKDFLRGMRQVWFL
jgi:hypothetical protein